MSRRRRLWIRNKIRAGKPLADTAIRSCQEVANIMTAKGYPMTQQRVLQLERQAIAKLRESELRDYVSND